jgi:chitin disaccharide deacetylase
MPRTLQLIVNADDFGAANHINEGIIEAHIAGVVTSASLMVNGDAIEHAVALAKKTPTLDLGLHITLVGERPVLAPTEVPSLCGKDGRLVKDAGAFVCSYLSGKIDTDELRAEIEAQILHAQKLGISLSHVDSHQHIHMLPGVLVIVKELAAKHRIAGLRVPDEAIAAYMLKERPARLLSLLILKSFCKISSSPSLARPDHFAGFFYGGRLDKQRLLTVLAAFPREGSCELMCHPGLGRDDSSYAAWNYAWADETAALTDPEVRDFINTNQISLIPFRALTN